MILYHVHHPYVQPITGSGTGDETLRKDCTHCNPVISVQACFKLGLDGSWLHPLARGVSSLLSRSRSNLTIFCRGIRHWRSVHSSWCERQGRGGIPERESKSRGEVYGLCKPRIESTPYRSFRTWCSLARMLYWRTCVESDSGREEITFVLSYFQISRLYCNWHLWIQSLICDYLADQVRGYRKDWTDWGESDRRFDFSKSWCRRCRNPWKRCRGQVSAWHELWH